MTVFHVKLGEDTGKMVLNGLLADVNTETNFPIAQPFGQKGKDFEFLSA